VVDCNALRVGVAVSDKQRDFVLLLSFHYLLDEAGGVDRALVVRVQLLEYHLHVLVTEEQR
jgi:hypothetical protein